MEVMGFILYRVLEGFERILVLILSEVVVRGEIRVEGEVFGFRFLRDFFGCFGDCGFLCRDGVE